MDQITHDVRSSQWLEIITQCKNRPEGTTAKQWMSDCPGPGQHRKRLN